MSIRTILAATTLVTSVATAALISVAGIAYADTPPVSPVGDGSYLVGTDIPAGTYVSNGGSDPETDCYWAREKNDSGELGSIIANNLSKGHQRVTLKSGEMFETRSCQDWAKAG